jgi:hypothetical protein
MNPILSDPVPELMRYLSVFRCGTDPIRSDTGAYTSYTLTALILSGPIPELIHPFPEWTRSDTKDLTPELTHPLPEWIRSYPIRYRSSHILFRDGSDRIRSDTGAHTPSSGMDPTLSDPIPELNHYLPVWNRSYPIRYRSLCILYRNESDPIRAGAGAHTRFVCVEPILSDPIPELIHIPPQQL